MSLVNLSHVCSHLQNASLARLGLTSIPYTRLHLSLSLLLQKQGFLSQVKLAGPSPPASCFPPGTQEKQYISSQTEYGRFTPEAALQSMVKRSARGNGADFRAQDAEALQKEGFGKAAIEFALSRREKTKAQLQRERWHEVAADFVLKHHERMVAGERAAARMDEKSRQIVLKYQELVEECRQTVITWIGDRAQAEEKEMKAAEDEDRRPRPYKVLLEHKIWDQVVRIDFDVETLRHFAGENGFVSSRELALDGVDIEAMGLAIPNQPFEAPNPKSDPWQLEEEGVVTQANRASRRLWLGLKYWDGLPVLRKAKMLSKPTKRIRLGENDLSKLVRGRAAGEVKPLTQIGEIMAVDTKLGVMEVRECVERRLGGMVLCRIW